MCNALGLRTVAEGIETEDQRDQLNELGCHLGQGYLFSRPVAYEAAIELVKPEAQELRES